MNIDQFDFNLPEDLIAQHPVNPRHNSKLLSCINSKLGDFHFCLLYTSDAADD